MKFNKLAFDCLYLANQDLKPEQIKSQLGLSDGQFDEYMVTFGLDEESLLLQTADARGIGRRFMELTAYKYQSEMDQQKGLPCPPAFKQMEGTVIDLPSPQETEIPELDLVKLIESRRSLRNYAEKPLSIQELSFLLWATQGVKIYKETEKISVTIRTVPSAGARHSLETYLYLHDVESIPRGLYFYAPQQHQLVEMSTDPQIGLYVSKACWEQSMVLTSAATFIWTAIPYRMTWRYGERSYRYLHLDAGHVCQNLYLGSEAIDAGVCAIGAYADELFQILLNLVPGQEFVIYAATVGKKPESAKK